MKYRATYSENESVFERQELPVDAKKRYIEDQLTKKLVEKLREEGLITFEWAIPCVDTAMCMAEIELADPTMLELARRDASFTRASLNHVRKELGRAQSENTRYEHALNQAFISLEKMRVLVQASNDARYKRLEHAARSRRRR